MKIELIDNHYLGNINYYKILFNSKHIELEQYEHHQKSGFANRCLIAGANGSITLSIPLLHGRNQRTPAREVAIDNRQKWQIKHWRAFESSYRRSPWFDYYRDDLKAFYGREYQYLYNWNKDLLIYILKILKWDGEISETLKYEENYPTTIYNDSRNRINPRSYLQDSTLKYTQVYEEKLGFLPNLSVVDLIFCCGNEAKSHFL